jgi:hypothetical protein
MQAIVFIGKLGATSILGFRHNPYPPTRPALSIALFHISIYIISKDTVVYSLNRPIITHENTLIF